MWLGLAVIAFTLGFLWWRRWRWLLLPGWREFVVAAADGRLRVRHAPERGWLLVAQEAPAPVWRRLPEAGFFAAVEWETDRLETR